MESWYLIERACFSLISALSRSWLRPAHRVGRRGQEHIVGLPCRLSSSMPEQGNMDRLRSWLNGRGFIRAKCWSGMALPGSHIRQGPATGLSILPHQLCYWIQRGPSHGPVP